MTRKTSTAVALLGAIVALASRGSARAEEKTAMPMPEANLSPAARSCNTFAAALWRGVAAEPGNVVVSPASLWIALVMTEGGARGETQREMRRVLALTGDAEATRTEAGRLLRGWNAAEGAYTLRVANRLFGEKTYAFEAAYLKATEATFGAPLEPLDFKGAAEPSRQRINRWVEERSEDRIKGLLPAGSIDRDVRLVLANAIYFLGKWSAPFAKEATRDASFHAAGGSTASVPTMHQAETFGYADLGDVQVLEMPYEGGDLAMDIVLPRDRDGLAKVEAELPSGGLARWLGGLSMARVIVALPKFTIDPAQAMSLGKVLPAMGMPLAFDRERADFTAMANPPDPADRLFVSKVFHKAFVRVDEAGTEAAAASAVVMTRAGSAGPVKPPPEFRADHPFLFFLRDRRSGMVLFAGRVADPRP